MRKWILGYGCILILTFLTAHWSSRAVTAFKEHLPPVRKHTVIVDAGHGGVDGGATSCTGVPESQFNLELALILNDLLHFLGHETIMIRTEDISVYTKGETIAAKKASDLKERVRIANEMPNGILLSIHQNQFHDSRYSGPQVFYASTSGSIELAAKLQTSLVSNLNPNSKRKEKASTGIYLMEHIRCPGILIECGFLSNPAEERKLRSHTYQKTLCTVIACTVSEFLANT